MVTGGPWLTADSSRSVWLQVAHGSLQTPQGACGYRWLTAHCRLLKEHVVTGGPWLTADSSRSVWLQVAHGSLLSTAARVNWNARWIAFSPFTSHRCAMCSDSVNTATILITGNHFTEIVDPSPRQHTMKIVSIALLCTGLQCKYGISTLTKHKFMSVFGVAFHYIASMLSLFLGNIHVYVRTCIFLEQLQQSETIFLVAHLLPFPSCYS